MTSEEKQLIIHALLGLFGKVELLTPTDIKVMEELITMFEESSNESE